jgi:hypothetical protein
MTPAIAEVEKSTKIATKSMQENLGKIGCISLVQSLLQEYYWLFTFYFRQA